tara:strand:+ start:280 stop:753 length:474 start_codon:yes stop_codon:yes gene_type:complete
LKESLEYNPDTGLFKWKRITPNGTKGWFGGSLSGTGDLVIRVYWGLYKAHRLASLYMEGGFPKEVVDHIDGNRTNNKWENLRACSQSNNTLNSRVMSNNTSGHKGVYWRKDRRKWGVRVQVTPYHYKSFGSHEDFELACLIADQVREKYHGEFANHG